jgi:hypothetical protein
MTDQDKMSEEKKPEVYVHVCTSSDMHPYNCEPPCIHCNGTQTPNHDTNTCALCADTEAGL